MAPRGRATQQSQDTRRLTRESNQKRTKNIEQLQTPTIGVITINSESATSESPPKKQQQPTPPGAGGVGGGGGG